MAAETLVTLVMIFDFFIDEEDVGSASAATAGDESVLISLPGSRFAASLSSLVLIPVGSIRKPCWLYCFVQPEGTRIVFGDP